MASYTLYSRLRDEREQTMNNASKKTIEQYRAMGWLAFHYPRKKRISLNGGHSMPEIEAVAEMKAAIKRHQIIA